MKYKSLFFFFSVTMLSGCEGGFTSTMNTITDSLNSFSTKVGSGSSWGNYSRIKASGTYTQGQVAISVSEAQLLTKAQIDPVLGRLARDIKYAHDDRDYAKKSELQRIHEEISKKLWTANDVIIFKVTNLSETDELPGDRVNYLFTNKKDGTKLKHFTASRITIDYMNEELYMVDRPSGEKVQYTLGNWNPIPPLESAYIALIQTRLGAGNYEATFNNVPVEFSNKIQKRESFRFEINKS